jgi:PAS domain S-box-containing protein
MVGPLSSEVDPKPMPSKRPARRPARAKGRPKANPRTELLVEAGRVLAGSLDLSATLANVARLAVPAFADWCEVDLLDEQGHLQREVVAHQDPVQVELHWELHQRFPPRMDAPSGPAYVVRTGKPELVRKVDARQLSASAPEPEHRQALVAFGLRSYMVVPLVARGRTLGALTLVRGRRRALYGPADLRVALDLGARVALAVDNAQLYEQAHRAGLRDRHSNQLVESLLASSPQGIAFFDRALRCVRVNAAFSALTDAGCALLGTDLEGLEPGLRGQLRPLLTQAASGVRAEGQLGTVRGRSLLACAFPLQGPLDTEVVGLTLVDVTERARFERALEEERRRLRSVLHHLPVGVMIAEGPDGRVVYGNPKVDELLGRPANLSASIEAYASTLGRWLDGRPVSRRQWPLMRAVQGEVVHGEEIEFPRPDGGANTVEVNAAPIRDGEGRVVGGVVAFSDITDRLQARRRAEALAAQLAEQQRWLEVLLDLSPVPLVLVAQGTAEVRFANRAAHQLAGGHFPPTAELPDPLPLWRAAKGERLVAAELEWRLPSGTLKLLVSSQSLPAMFGREEAIVLSFLDVTQLKEVEEELQQAVRARDEFLAVASHELRTPLTSLKLGVQHLIRQGSAGRESVPSQLVVTRAEQVNRQIARLEKLIHNLLDVSRINTGRIELEVEPVDLGEVVREAASRLGEDARRAGCLLSLRIEEGVVGRWDRLRLEQVASNLLSNALKYGGGQPVEVRVHRAGLHAYLVVRDHGVGISPEHHARIFRRFERAVSGRNYSGFGLGLWIVRQIIEALGGHIELQSEESKGSCFTVMLPAAAAEISEAPSDPSAQQAS